MKNEVFMSYRHKLYPAQSAIWRKSRYTSLKNRHYSLPDSCQSIIIYRKSRKRVYYIHSRQYIRTETNSESVSMEIFPSKGYFAY